MLAQGGEERVAARARAPTARPASSTRPSASSCSKLLAFPAEVAEAAERRAPHRIAAYALELAQDFTAFYRDCQVVGRARGGRGPPAALCVATQRTHRAGARRCSASRAPEQM